LFSSQDASVTLCVPPGYAADTDSDCCPVGAGTTAEYPGLDDDGGACLQCNTGDNTQIIGGTGDGSCEVQCGASSECDELAKGFSNSTLSCSATCQVNYKPIVVEAVITPSTPETTDTLDCGFNVTDSDSGSVTANVTWFKNGSPWTNDNESVDWGSRKRVAKLQQRERRI